MIQQLAFISGVPRSGTTAITQLLNVHPQVCIGMERYKLRVSRGDPIIPGLFERDRFFDLRSEDTSIRPGMKGYDLYGRLAKKWGTARVVGDKVPYLCNGLEALWSSCPGAKVLYMLRDVNGVASSWNARALNPEDAWPQESDYRKAVGAWNGANSNISKFAGAANLMIVSYERFFSGDDGELRRVTEFVGIDPDRELLSNFKAKCNYFDSVLRKKDPTVLPGQQAFIEANSKWTFDDGRLQTT